MHGVYHQHRYGFVGFVFYQEYLKSKYPHLYQPKPKAAQTEQQKATEMDATPAPSGSAVEKVAEKPAKTKEEVKTASTSDYKQLSPEQLTIETDNRLITFDQNLSAITSIKLKDYKESVNGDGAGKTVELLDSPVVIQGAIDPEMKFGETGFSGERNGNAISFSAQREDWQVKQVLTIPAKGYGIDIVATFTNTSDKARRPPPGPSPPTSARGPQRAGDQRAPSGPPRCGRARGYSPPSKTSTTTPWRG